MAAALVVASAFAGSPNGGTTTGVDTTGATLLVLAVTGFRNASQTGVSDNKGNTFSALTASSVSGAAGTAQIFYCASPTVGTGHTATVAGTNSLTGLFLLAFSGIQAATPFDQQNHFSSGSGTTIQPGSITPTQANELVVAVVGADTTNSFSAPSGFTLDGSIGTSSNNFVGSAVAHQIQTAATAVNPSWAVSAPFAANGAVIASFFAAAGGGTVALVGQTLLALSGRAAASAAAALKGQGLLALQGRAGIAAAAALRAQALLALQGRAGLTAGLALKGQSQLTLQGRAAPSAKVALSGQTTLALRGQSVLQTGTAALTGQGLLTLRGQAGLSTAAGGAAHEGWKIVLGLAS